MENKLNFQRELGRAEEPKIPLLCVPGGMTEDMGGAEFEEVLPGILSLNCQMIVRGVGSEKYGSLFTELERNHSHRIKIIKDDDTLRRKIYAAADMSLFFAPDGDELLNCLAYGTVPIAPAQEFLEDYNPAQESGNAFLAEPHTSWNWFASLVRGIETYKLPYDFRTIQKHAMLTLKEE